MGQTDEPGEFVRSEAGQINFLTKLLVTRLGYNHGCEYREASPADFAKVTSKTAYSEIATR